MAAGRVLTPPLDVTEAFVIKVFLRCTDFPARVPLTGLFIPKPFTADQAASVIPAFLAVWRPMPPALQCSILQSFLTYFRKLSESVLAKNPSIIKLFTFKVASVISLTVFALVSRFLVSTMI